MAQKQPKTKAFSQSTATGFTADPDSYTVITKGGIRIKIKKSIIPKIPHFEKFFDPSSSRKNSRGEFLLPPEIDGRYFKPIVTFVETGQYAALLTELPIKCHPLHMADLFKYLGIKEPEVGNLQAISIDSLEDASKFCVGILMDLFEIDDYNRAHYDRCIGFIGFISTDRKYPKVFRRHATEIINIERTKSQKMIDLDESESSNNLSPDDDDDDEYDDVGDFGAEFDRRAKKGKVKEKDLIRQRERRIRKPKWRDNDDN